MCEENVLEDEGVLVYVIERNYLQDEFVAWRVAKGVHELWLKVIYRGCSRLTSRRDLFNIHRVNWLRILFSRKLYDK